MQSLTRCSAQFPLDDLVIDRGYDNTRAPAETTRPDAEKKPGSEAGEYKGSVVGTGTVVIHHHRSKALPTSFKVLAASIQELDKQPGFTAKPREPDPLIDYILLTNRAGKRQWSYLDSSTRSRRRVIVADICYQEKWYSLVEFQQRDDERFTIALVMDDEYELVPYLKLNILLVNLSNNKGLWGYITKSEQLSIKIISMKHTWSSTDAYSTSLLTKIKLNHGSGTQR